MDKFLTRCPIVMNHGVRDSGEEAIWYNTERGWEDELWDKMLRFVCACFKTDLISWKISDKDLKETDCFRKLYKFNKIYQRINPINPLEVGTTDKAITLSREDLRICLEDTACDFSTFINVTAPKYTGGLYHRRIHIQGASWLTVQTLLKMEDCEEIQADSEVTLTSEDINKFIVRWMTSRDQSFKLMVLAPLSFTPGEMRTVVLKGTHATLKPPKEIPTTFRGHQIHPTETRYILSSDGKLAAVMNVEGVFKMMVFDDENKMESEVSNTYFY